jgi:Protein of unknown function (DUF2844)
MNKYLNSKIAAFLSLALIAGLSPRTASATLGEPEASVQTDAAELQGSIKSMTNGTAYRVHEMQLPSGTALREFVAPDGNVFAVAWKGPMPPNLRQAFGQYFEGFVAAAKQRTGDRTHLQIQTADLVVQARGHARSFAGRAYLPASLPSGFDLGDLQ